MAFVFTPQRVRELRQREGQISACMVLTSLQVREGTARNFSREIAVYDENNVLQDKRRERVQDVRWGGELRAARLTVHIIELVDVYGDDPLSNSYKVLDLEAAKACGFKTVLELRDDWRARHRMAATAKLIWFSMGDNRDKDRYLQRYIHRGGDYTGDRSDAVDELPALTEEQLQEVAAHAHQRDLKRLSVVEHSLSEETLAQRVARIENAGDQVTRELKNELKIIAERARRGLKKLDRAS